MENTGRPRSFKSCIGRLMAVMLVVFLTVGADAPYDQRVEVTETSRAINAFTVELLHDLSAKQGASANAVFSGQSLYHGLAMSYVGSGGQTRKELASACGFPAVNAPLLEELGKIHSAIIDSGDKGVVQVTLANALWLDDTHADFRKDYLFEVKSAFDVALNGVKFADTERSSSTINQWIEEKSRGRIRNAVSPASLASRSFPGVIDEPALVLVNAVYFKGNWKSRFDETLTKDLPFHLVDGGEVDVPMMHQTSILSYAENENYQFLEMRYVDRDYSMYILLPKTVKPVSAIFWDLMMEDFFSLHNEAYDYDVDVLLPKFELGSSFSVVDALGKRGVKAAFDPHVADFDRMIVKKAEAYRVYISDCLQDAWIEVNEEGTEAAAATQTVHFSIGCSASVETMPAKFHADHPFVYLIMHNPSRSILFGGWISDPRLLTHASAE